MLGHRFGLSDGRSGTGWYPAPPKAVTIFCSIAAYVSTLIPAVPGLPAPRIATDCAQHGSLRKRTAFLDVADAPVRRRHPGTPGDTELCSRPNGGMAEPPKGLLHRSRWRSAAL